MKCQQNNWTGCIVHLADAVVFRGKNFLDYSDIYRRSANEKLPRFVFQIGVKTYWLANKLDHV